MSKVIARMEISDRDYQTLKGYVYATNALPPPASILRILKEAVESARRVIKE